MAENTFHVHDKSLTTYYCITLYSPVVTICTASLTINNYQFCPHSVFMCFVCSSEQTAITCISLYIINWLVFITETECVYCAVRAESLPFRLIFVLSLLEHKDCSVSWASHRHTSTLCTQSARVLNINPASTHC
jgi:hypothetical protein